ncbi:MAG: hypothetical protein AABX35_01715 [Nanoarchaeota archaeon]
MDKRIIRLGDGEGFIVSLPIGTGEGISQEAHKEVARALLSLFTGTLTSKQRYCFSAGSFLEFNPEAYIPLSKAMEINEMLANISSRPPFFRSSRKELEDRLASSMSKMLAKETTLDLKKFNIHPVRGSTRDAIEPLFNHFKKSRKSIALPIPNWYFWDNEHGVRGNHSFKYFEALNEDQLVSGFKKLAKKGEVGSVVISNPMTPLGYEISRGAAKEIDCLALQNGVKVLVDDVLRGTRELDNRDTLASVFTNPYFAEGFGHRIALDNNIGSLSYVGIPKNDRKVKMPEFEHPQYIPAFVPLFELVMEHASGPALEELRKRNSEFDAGFRETAPDSIKLKRLYPTSITSLITLPDNIVSDGVDIEYSAKKKYGAGIAPINMFYPDNHSIPKNMHRNLRSSVGGTPLNRIREGARLMGMGLTEFMK